MTEVRVVAGAVIRDGRVLGALRGPEQRLPHVWELPGGKVEAGESDAQALRRELHEELGVHVRVGGWIGESTHAYPHVSVRLVAYACALELGEPRPTEHAELRWLAARELHDLEWAPADVPLLDAVRALLDG